MDIKDLSQTSICNFFSIDQSINRLAVCLKAHKKYVDCVKFRRIGSNEKLRRQALGIAYDVASNCNSSSKWFNECVAIQNEVLVGDSNKDAYEGSSHHDVRKL